MSTLSMSVPGLFGICIRLPRPDECEFRAGVYKGPEEFIAVARWNFNFNGIYVDLMFIAFISRRGEVDCLHSPDLEYVRISFRNVLFASRTTPIVVKMLTKVR